MSYISLEPDEILATARKLETRIVDRFPNADIGKVAGRVVQVTSDAKERAAWMAKPILLLRIFVGFLILIFCLLIYALTHAQNFNLEPTSLPELLQAIEAGTNEILLIAAGIFFLFSLEVRIKRRKGLKALHDLRVLAHLIDLHQLTKDPARLDRSPQLWTLQSPNPSMDAFLLTRYLDYCSEMLSLVGKVAALYAYKLADPVLLSAVNEVEDLSSGLSRKIWQKIMIITSNR